MFCNLRTGRCLWVLATLLITLSLGSKPAKSAGGSTFVNGTNIAWVWFAQDIGTGNPPLEDFRLQFRRLSEAAGPKDTAVARLWLHVDGRLTPQFGSDGTVIGPGPNAVSDLKKILDVAAQERVRLLLVLWAHDMLRTSGQPWNILERNRKVLTDDGVMQSYINFALKPLVVAVDNHPGLFGWDIFNEPEGITVDKAWDIIDPKLRVPMETVQKFANRVAGVIRRHTSSSVTVGSVDPSFLPYWEDSALFKAGGDKDGYLDYFQVHYYASMGPKDNPFQVKAESYKMSKPIMVGEFWPHEAVPLGSPTREAAYARLRENGYLGALAWKDAQYPDLEPILEMIRYNRTR